MRRSIRILEKFSWETGHDHSCMTASIGNYTRLLREMEISEEEIKEWIESVLNRESEK